MKLLKILLFSIFLHISSMAETKEDIAEIKEEIEEISREMNAMEKSAPHSSHETDSIENKQLPSIPPKGKIPTSLQQNLKEVRIELNEIAELLFLLRENSASRDFPTAHSNLQESSPPLDKETPIVTQKKLITETQPESISFNQDDNPIVLQKIAPSNYIILSPGFIFSTDLEYSTLTGSTGEFQTDNGFGLNLELGRTLGALEIGMLIGFDRNNLESFTLGGSNYLGAGTSTAYKLALQPAINIEISEYVDLRLGTGLGFANRHDSFDFSSGSTIYEENLCFLFNLYSSIGLKVSEYSSIIFGYRFSYLGESDKFSDYLIHSFEIGGQFKF